MGFRINTNIVSQSAQRSLGLTNLKQGETLNQLSSGSRITKAGDDAAGLAISEKLKANIRSLNQAGRNANDGISLIQTAEGGLTEISSMLIRLRELSVQSASDTVGEVERSFSDLEFQSLKEEIERIAQVTEFNGKKLLNGTHDKLDFQIGVNNVEGEDRVSYEAGQINSTLGELGVEGLDITSKDGARDSMGHIDSAMEHLNSQRAVLGALQNRLQSTQQNIQVQAENMSAANSRIRDTDFASASADNAKWNILQNSGTAVLAQANQQGRAALSLIG